MLIIIIGHKSSKTPIHFFKTTGQATEIYPVGYVYTTIQNGITEVLSCRMNTHVSNYKLRKIENPADGVFKYTQNKPTNDRHNI
ncbi:MAG: hypothetical protein H8D22_02185 [Candidatus Cloacimonetes bacterium]|nr:hypothetical protein [Candidatus Cloacimonadota bacterium]